MTQRYAKNALSTRLRPGPRWGSSGRSPDPLVGWGGDTHAQTSPHSAPSAPRFSLRRRSPLVPPPQPGASGCFIAATGLHNLRALTLTTARASESSKRDDDLFENLVDCSAESCSSQVGSERWSGCLKVEIDKRYSEVHESENN